MLANHSSAQIHYWAGKYPGRVGWLVGPSTVSQKKYFPWLPYACDNDAWGSYAEGREWDAVAFWKMLDFIDSQDHRPLWVAVPDVVANRVATLRNWGKYAPRCRDYGHELAFVAQDGMTPSDIPVDADIVFMGGTYSWKWRNLEKFCENFPRIHVGRVNTLQKIRRSEELGAESGDGTGWFRRPLDEFRLLEDFLSMKPSDQIEFDL
tara:strand:- start:61 stop:681 length:621 start_codon:yes stop_codon:yes gene_type:complete